jgi:UDP-3-O-[3-hydroxymyristoyl] glucosamine N-acyltransferase
MNAQLCATFSIQHQIMKVTAAQLAALLGGSIEGNPNATVSRPMRIEDAVEGDFAFFDNPKYEHYAYTTLASILLVGNDFVPTQPVTTTLLRVTDVRKSLAFLLEQFADANTRPAKAEISAQAAIHPEANIGQGTSIGAFAVLEAGVIIGDNCVIAPQVFLGKNVKIGNNTVLHPGVKVFYDCQIGANCIIHANAVIGADGFGNAPMPDGSWQKIPQVGDVRIGNNVEIGANTCIDRAGMGSTIIHNGVKLDNLVHIAHGVEVGEHTAMAAQVGIAGSAKIGANCQLGGQVGIAGHITLAKGTRLQAQSGVGSTIKVENQAFFGSPAIPYGDYVRAYIVFKELPDLAKRLRALEKGIQK